MPDHPRRAEILRRQIVEPEADDNAGNAGGSRRAGIISRIAHVSRAPAPGPRDHFMEQVGRRLCPARPQCIAADHGKEPLQQTQLAQQPDRQTLQLVGDDGNPDAAIRKTVKHPLAARKQDRMARDIRLVKDDQFPMEPFKFLVRDRPAGHVQSAGKHLARTAANKITHSGRWHGFPPDQRKRVIHRLGQVHMRVEQGPVEIETDNIEGEGNHWRIDGFSRWNRQAITGRRSAMTDAAPPLAIIVLAAGKGTRMRSDLHKVLHPVAGRPMLDHLLESTAGLEPHRQVVVAGHGREQLETALDDQIAIAVQEPQLGTAHAVQQAKAALDGFSGDVLILYGDVPFVKPETMRAMTARLNEPDSPAIVVLGFEPDDPLRYGRVIASEGRIAKMVEYGDASEQERACRLCNSGVMAVRSQDLFALLARVGNDNAQGEYYLPDIVNLALGDGRTCAVVVTDDPAEVAGINSRAELAAAERRWQERRRLQAMAEGATLIDPDTVWFAWDTRLGRDILIEPNVFFGPGVEIADNVTIHGFCHIEGASIAPDVEIGPFARLRPGARLETKSKIGNFVEMKKSVLGKGSKANHLTYLGDTEVGEGANIGAGTITCNYDGYFKHQTVIGDRAFIGSNSALIAPVKIGADAIVAAGSAVSRDVADGELRLVRAEQLVKPGWADSFHDAMKKKKKAAEEQK